jgi:acetylornithine/N-succinyldiaminopimelate aminotransferase
MVRGVRGAGLLRAIELSDDVATVVADRGLTAGFIINAPTPDVLRLAPPLVISTTQVDSFVTALPALLEGLEPTS